jgi:acyl-CoA synthetase (AMP-forming)/AMP-acid ligase II
MTAPSRSHELTFAEHLDKILDQHSGRTFLIDLATGRELTYDAIAVEITQTQSQLAPLLDSRQPVAVLLPNSAEFFVVCMALMQAEQTFFLFSPDWPAAAVIRHIDALKPSLLITSPDLAGPLGLQLPIHISRAVFAYVMPGVASDSEAKFISPRVFLATSGTTGLNKWVPKGITEIANNLKAWADRLDLRCDDRVHSMLPLCTANGLYITFLMPFLVGAAVVLDQRFTGARLPAIYRNVCAQRSTVLSIVPTILYMTNAMLGDPEAAQFCSRSLVRFAICGTAPLDPVEKHRFARRMNVPVCFNFGTTETMFVSSQAVADWEGDSTGRLLEGMEASVADDGEVIVGKDGPFEPYFGAERGGFRTDGRFATGDLGRFDAGCLAITGRKKDMVIVGGFNVFPVEIDHLIIREPFVIDTYTFGVPNPLLGEELVSAVVTDTSIAPNQATSSIEERLASQLPSYKVPRVVCVKEIIKTPTGKPIKRAMIEELRHIDMTRQNSTSTVQPRAI